MLYAYGLTNRHIMKNPFRHIFKREQGSPSIPVVSSVASNVAPLYVGESDLSISTIYRCIKLLSESVAQLPLACMRLTGQNNLWRREYAYDRVLSIEPMPGMNAFDYWSAVVSDMLIYGNAYIIPQLSMDPNAPISALHLCRFNTVNYNWQTGIYNVRGMGQGIDGTYTADEVVHLRFNSTRDHKKGVGILAYAQNVMALSHAGDIEAYNRIATGGNVRGLISYGGPSGLRGQGRDQDRELERYAESMSRKINANGINAMAGDVKFQQFSLSSTDLQFLETRKFAVRDICRFFGVHPSFVFDDGTSNYKSAENANAAFLSTALNPILCRIEAELRTKLIPADTAAFYKFEFDRKKIKAIDPETKLNWQKQAIETGLMTINEMRAQDNLPPVEGGDTTFLSANLKNINEANNEI